MRNRVLDMKRKLTKWEWAMLLASPLIVVALIWGGRIWFSLTGILYTQQQEIVGIAFSSDSKELVVVAASDKSLPRVVAQRSYNIMKWDVATGKLLFKAEVRDKKFVWSPKILKDGTIVALVLNTNDVWELWRWSNGQSEKTLDLKKCYVDLFRPLRDDQKTLFLTRRTLRGSQGEIWDLYTRKRLRSFPYGYNSWNTALSPDGSLLATIPRKKVRKRLNNSSNEVKDVDLVLKNTRDGHTIKTFRHIRAAQLWNTQFSSDGKKLLCGGGIYKGEYFQNSVIQIIDIQTNQIQTLNMTDSLLACHFSPNGELIITRTMDKESGGMLSIWSVKSGQPLKSFYIKSDWPPSGRISPDGKTLAYTIGNSIHLVDVSNLK